MNENFRQMPLFVLVDALEVTDEGVWFYTYAIWWHGLCELVNVLFVPGGE